MVKADPMTLPCLRHSRLHPISRADEHERSLKPSFDQAQGCTKKAATRTDSQQPRSISRSWPYRAVIVTRSASVKEGHRLEGPFPLFHGGSRGMKLMLAGRSRYHIHYIGPRPPLDRYVFVVSNAGLHRASSRPYCCSCEENIYTSWARPPYHFSAHIMTPEST